MHARDLMNLTKCLFNWDLKIFATTLYPDFSLDAPAERAYLLEKFKLFQESTGRFLSALDTTRIQLFAKAITGDDVTPAEGTVRVLLEMVETKAPYEVLECALREIVATSATPEAVDKPADMCGLYQKYVITRKDGKPLSKGLHFVLSPESKDPAHRVACRNALRIYSRDIRSAVPKLADDLDAWLDLTSDAVY